MNREMSIFASLKCVLGRGIQQTGGIARNSTQKMEIRDAERA